MTVSPGRGRPVVFDATTQDQYLKLVSDGVRLGQAATQCGVDRRTPNHLAARDPGFAERLTAAKTQGALAPRPPKPLVHGKPGTYNNHHCRCGPCTTAASRARSNAPDRKTADIHHLPDTQQSAGETKLLMLAEVS